MYTTFLGACLASVALSLNIRSELQLPDTSPVKYFAQAGATVSTTVCQRTANRNKEEVPDFYKLYSGSEVFNDSVFPHTSADVLAWADANESFRDSHSSFTWKRAKDAFSDHTLFGTNGVTPQDMRQGSIGNCWFISAASALSEHPGRVEKIFLNANNEISKNGIYAVQLYTLGVPHTVVVDDYLPLHTWGGKLTTYYAGPSPDKAIYGPILEKAFAKYHGNYKHIVGGDPIQAIKTLYGAPATQHHHNKTTADKLWNALEAADTRGDIIQCGTNGSNHARQNAVGLALGHAYTVLGVVTIQDASGNDVRLVKMRNPWGTEKYHSDYSDSSPLWTDASRAKAGSAAVKKENDGEFFVPIDIYLKYVAYTQINFNMDNVTEAHHLTLNAPKNNKTGKYFCSDCTWYKFNVTTAKDQKVNMKFATWETRGIPSTCKAQYAKNQYGNSKHYHIAYYRGGHFGTSPQGAIASKGGEIDFGQQELKAGQTYSVEVELDFGDEEEARDFSVVVHGMEGGNVTVERSDGVASDKLPVIWRDGEAPSNAADTTTDTDTATDTAADTATDTTTDTTTDTSTDETTPISDDTFGNNISEELNARVKAYTQWDNFGVCGSGYKWHENGTETVELIMKNTCKDYSLVSEYTLTLDQTVWADTRALPMFDTRPGEKKYTHISDCQKLANDREKCTITLRKINGVMQNSAAITLPYWYGNMSMNSSHYQDRNNYDLQE